ncbi:MAG: type III pantothenate kinase [Spirulina sp. SIO3F2]|nr:type III pantothenate kinase [Spirulina sp. SIO3F2]
MYSRHSQPAQTYLVLTIGNSQLRWAAIAHSQICQQGNASHRHEPASRKLLPAIYQDWPLYILSVVPEQLQWWQAVPNSQVITLEDVPLAGKYATLGSDRAVAAYGAMQHYGAPVLVIDGGTAWTLTAIDANSVLQGGAILPGLALQYQSLSQGTASLPDLALSTAPPNRWSTKTIPAIHSGIQYTLLAGIKDFIQAWRADYSQSPVILTGGSGAWLWQQLSGRHYADLHYEPNLILQGMVALIGSG